MRKILAIGKPDGFYPDRDTYKGLRVRNVVQDTTRTKALLLYPDYPIGYIGCICDVFIDGDWEEYSFYCVKISKEED